MPAVSSTGMSDSASSAPETIRSATTSTSNNQPHYGLTSRSVDALAFRHCSGKRSTMSSALYHSCFPQSRLPFGMRSERKYEMCTRSQVQRRYRPWGPLPVVKRLSCSQTASTVPVWLRVVVLRHVAQIRDDDSTSTSRSKWQRTQEARAEKLQPNSGPGLLVACVLPDAAEGRLRSAIPAS